MALEPVKIQMKAEYLKGETFVCKAVYESNNSTAIILCDRFGHRDLVATVCLGDTNPPPGHVFIKTWSENEGVLQSLIDHKVLRDTFTRVLVGHNCQVAICELIMELPDAH